MTATIFEQTEAYRVELAQQKHTPTRAMQVTAKRGIRLSPGKNVSPEAMAVGRKVAAGQKLSSQHVDAMANYHASHSGSCPTGTDDGSVEDMLWGGAAGSNWSGARMAAMDVSELAEIEGPSILALDQEGKRVSLEVFVRDALGEPTEVEPDKGLIWAPILRSGMLAMRPGPNGEKLNEPLVFVPGKASDPRKEIGLENLTEAFDDGAIQHVTIPTSHDNGVLDNTGFIKSLRIVDSKQRPGEKVLAAAHDFRDPDVRRKVELGTIANRSCGIVYDYVNTETGKKYSQALEHVALTNRPWVTGMAAYGEISSDEDFADREVVPMLLSEAPRHTVTTTDTWDGSVARFSDEQWTRSCVIDLGEDQGDGRDRYDLPIRDPEGAINAEAVKLAAKRIGTLRTANLAQKREAARTLIAAYRQLGDKAPDDVVKLCAATTHLTDAERKATLLADVQWGDSDGPSLNDIESQVLSQLKENYTNSDEFYPYWYVKDVKATKVLACCEYGGADPNDSVVIPINVDGDQVQLADFSDWVWVEQQWVTDEDANADKQEVGSILGDKQNLSAEPPAEVLNLATLTAKQRKDMPASDFVFPATREYPIPDIAHARNALSRGAQNETGARLRKIKNAVNRRYPQLKNNSNSDSKTKMSLASDPLKGGAMTPTTVQLLERLGLSEDQRAAVDAIVAENQTLSTKLGEVTKTTRETAVKNRVKDLQDKGFPPGFCKRYEEIGLGDDGDVAASLNLSEEGKTTSEREYTATELAESLIACLPVDDSGKLALADRANLLTSPVSERPPLTAADQAEQEEKDGNKTPQTGEEWLTEAEKVAPGIAAQAGLKLSTDKKEAE